MCAVEREQLTGVKAGANSEACERLSEDTVPRLSSVSNKRVSDGIHLLPYSLTLRISSICRPTKQKMIILNGARVCVLDWLP